MSVNEGYQAADGAVRLEDQSQIVNSLERLTLDDQTHGNQAAVTQRLGQIAVNEDDSQRRNIFSSLDELDVGEDEELMSKSVVQSKTNKGSQRLRKQTEKGAAYRLSILEERKKKLTKKIYRQSGEINDLLRSNQNYTTVKEQMLLFDDVFQMLIEVHQDMVDIRKDAEEEAWFAEIDEQVFTFKHKVNNWMKEVAETRTKSSSSHSKGSKRSSKSSSSSSRSKSSTKERAMQEKLRVAELLAEADFLEKKRTAQYQAEVLQVEEKLAKAKARMNVYNAAETTDTEIKKYFNS